LYYVKIIAAPKERSGGTFLPAVFTEKRKMIKIKDGEGKK
jgi:hypothetical protein